jgi:hypothetical protein
VNASILLKNTLHIDKQSLRILNVRRKFPPNISGHCRLDKLPTDITCCQIQQFLKSKFSTLDTHSIKKPTKR